nr:GNAT family N-acetyltransferase [Micromonospora sp. HNM0581]
MLLRPWRASDADTVYRACQDPAIQRWTAVPSPYRVEDAQNFVGSYAPTVWATGSGAPFAVCDAASGELLGSCGLISIDQARRSGEVGYWTAPWARGRGVAVRATRATARWAFDTLALRHLLWRAELGNHASRLVALRAGFRVEGRLRSAHRAAPGWRPGWIGSLLPEELAGPGADGPAGPGTLPALRAAVFGRPQPTLFTNAAKHEIRLRPMDEHDLDAVVDTCRDPDTLRWTNVPKDYGLADAESFLTFCTAGWAGATSASFVIADPSDRYAGSIDLRLSDTDPLLADVGFMTAPHARGRGYQPAALAALCTWGFAALGLARVEWRANVGNVASRRAAEKAGFVLEGTARRALNHRGDRVDAWVGALLAEDLV